MIPSMQAVTDGVVWRMDRATFRRIILASRIARRERFEETLKGMSIFASLSANQLASIADCLELEIAEARHPNEPKSWTPSQLALLLPEWELWALKLRTPLV